MRLLVDECLPERLATELSLHGHDVAHVVVLGLAGSADSVVLGVAADQDRILISVDTDFGFLLASEGLERPSVILLRHVSYVLTDQIGLILDCLAVARDDLAAGCMAVVTSRGARIRRLPIA